jgi:cytochrome c oxidase assembly protein subunit 15
MTLSAAVPREIAPAAENEAASVRAVRLWLYVLAASIFVMIIVGGATRLTESGLSITEWRPVTGVLPPFSEGEWLNEFEKYRQIPQYQLINKGMSLEAFKTIYWWEWAHRFLGRVVGLIFLVPFLYFLVRGYFARGVPLRLFTLFVLGALQGVLGWWMVASGLADRTEVSQYRLAAHLGLAFILFGMTLWFAFSLVPEKGRAALRRQSPGRSQAWPWGAALLTGAIYVQVILGAFVAGIRGGMGYNTWPLMDGHLVPGGLLVMSPWYMNLFENALTVQFNHRMLAYGIVAAVLAYAVYVFRRGAAELRASAALLAAAVVAQAGLGIWTLLAQVPVSLGVAHQGMAAILLGIALWHLHRTLAVGHPAASA